MNARVASVLEAVGSCSLVVAGAMVDVALGFAVGGVMCWLYAWRSTS